MGFPKNSNFRVIFAGLAANILYLGTGCLLSYPSPAVPNINAIRNPFRVDSYQQSWIGSLSLLGALVGSIVSGMIADAIGRKLTMMSASIVCVAGLTVVSSATNVQTMYIGLFITGIFNSINGASVYLYCAEIAAHDNRGILLSITGITSTIGSLAVLAVGSYIPWNWLAIFVAIFFVIPPMILVFLPESPRWFFMKGNKKAATHGLLWFRGEHADIDMELNVIAESLVDAFKGISAWKDLFQKENAMPLLLCCTLISIQAFSGNFIMAIFTVTIFKEARVNVDPNVQSIITTLFSFFGSIFCVVFIERCGRRRLLLISTSFTALGMGMLASFFQVEQMDSNYATDHLTWLPMLGISISNFMFYAGLFSIPWVFSCELFPTNVRAVVQSVANAFSQSMSFAAAKTFNDIQNSITTAGAFWVYAGCGVVGVFFTLFVVKEPKRVILD